MNLQSQAVQESSVESRAAAAPVELPAAQGFYWSVRREFWESRSIYIAPLTVAGLILVGFLLSTIHLAARMRAALALGPAEQQKAIEQPYNVAAMLMMGTFVIVAVVYCLDALYGERRDRSILFWKSLPVSDLTIVVAKASIPIVVLPVITVALTVVTQWIMLLISSVVLLGSGISVAAPWNHLPMWQMSLLLLDHVLGVHGLWYAPLYCWLLLISAWAKRATILWAGLPPLAIGVIEKMAFNSSHFVDLMKNRFMGGPEGAGFMAGTTSMEPLSHISPLHFLISPGLWLGLVFAAGLLAAAARVRRYREPL